MLYQLYDDLAQRGAVMNEMYELIHDITSSPSNPFSYTLAGRLTNATLETSMRFMRRYEKLGFNITHTKIEGKDVAVEEEITLSKPFCNLLHFKHEGRWSKSKVLLVAPLSGHHATLCKGTVEALLPEHEVYVTDWLDARDVPRGVGKFCFDLYVSYLIEFMESLGEDLHVVAICQPTVQALIATAVLAERKSVATPKSLTLMAGPIDVSKNPTRVNDYAVAHPIDFFKNFVIMKVPRGYPGEGREVYPGFMQLGGFISMNAENHARKHLKFFTNLLYGENEDAERFRGFYDEYMAVLDLPAEFYIETIERVFQKNEISEGTITYEDEPVNFNAITKTALLTVEGADDDICGIGQTEAAHEVCAKLPKRLKKHHLQVGAGHYGIFSGSKFRKHIRPLITEFIGKHG